MSYVEGGIVMAVASSWAGWASAQPLFHRPNWHTCTFNYVESKIVATSCVIPEKLLQATVHPDLRYLQQFLVHSVVVPSLAATKPKT